MWGSVGKTLRVGSWVLWVSERGLLKKGPFGLIDSAHRSELCVLTPFHVNAPLSSLTGQKKKRKGNGHAAYLRAVSALGE